jgi:hypothetical protein
MEIRQTLEITIPPHRDNRNPPILVLCTTGPCQQSMVDRGFFRVPFPGCTWPDAQVSDRKEKQEIPPFPPLPEL